MKMPEITYCAANIECLNDGIPKGTVNLWDKDIPAEALALYATRPQSTD